jgi:dTDP-4-amino-4,6-dideoxygalactose transaminase
MATMTTIPFGKPMIGEEERAATLDVLSGSILTHGPRVKEFESAFAEFTGAPHAVATATCMASLHLASLAIDLQPGEEVLVPAQTHVATAHAVELCGAKPVFVDAEPRTGNLDLDALESLITPRTRAVSLVHFLGRPVDMPRLLEIARKHDLFVIEDCAVALGARVGDAHVGLLGDVGCFSFYPVKHITTGEGGMVITTRDDIADRIGKQRAFGIDRSILADRRHTGEYDIDHVGLNYRLGEIGAALGVAQMAKLPGFLEHRERIYGLLHDGLSGFEHAQLIDSGHDGELRASFYCLSFLLAPPLAGRREAIIDDLKAAGVGSSVYYPKALPDTRYYRRRYGYAHGSCGVATRISETSIALPVAPHVSDADAERIVTTVKETLSRHAGHA